ncbi:MAG TPA: hypothetical protein VFQ44_01725 [Streptosporangiaceae bacterium]|nr:hypothetical protein [Streptosporangiaceae bacterium]
MIEFDDMACASRQPHAAHDRCNGVPAPGWDAERLCDRPVRYSAVNGQPDFGGDGIDYLARIYGTSRADILRRYRGPYGLRGRD